jgi:hypothetical protein
MASAASEGTIAGAAGMITVLVLVDSLILRAGDLLHQIDDRTPKLCVWNPHGSFGEVEPFGRGEIV